MKFNLAFKGLMAVATTLVTRQNFTSQNI